jgi:hypothetical protein
MAHTRKRIKYRWKSPDGYIHISTDVGEIIGEHRHVWECAHGPIPDGYQIHHIDRDRSNNKLWNLAALKPRDHKRAHCGHWTDQSGRWWKRCTSCHCPAPEFDFPTKRYRADGVRMTRGNCKTCERDRQRAKNGWKGREHPNFGRHYPKSSFG